MQLASVSGSNSYTDQLHNQSRRKWKTPAEIKKDFDFNGSDSDDDYDKDDCDDCSEEDFYCTELVMVTQSGITVTSNLIY